MWGVSCSRWRSCLPSTLAGAGKPQRGVIQSRPPNVLKHIHLPDLLGIWVWRGGCCTILPNKTQALLDLFLGRARDWLGNRLGEPTHTAGLPEGLHRFGAPFGGLMGVRRHSTRSIVKRGILLRFYKGKLRLGRANK